jgi:hypothetical protein
MGKAPTGKKPARPKPGDKTRLPGTRGTMKPDELIELMRKWVEEGDPEEDREVYTELEEESARTRG